MSINVDQLLQHVYSATEEDRRAINILLTTALWNAQQSGDVKSVNELLERIDPKQMINYLCLSVLTNTFATRLHYPAWESTRARIVETLVFRLGKEQASKMLLGFYLPCSPKEASGTDEAFDKLIGIHPTLVRHNRQEW